MTNIGNYVVPVTTVTKIPTKAILEPAQKKDMPIQHLTRLDLGLTHAH